MHELRCTPNTSNPLNINPRLDPSNYSFYLHQEFKADSEKLQARIRELEQALAKLGDDYDFLVQAYA